MSKKKPHEIPYIPTAAMRQIAVPIASLVLDPDNERKHDRANIDAIKGLIRKFGIMEPIGVREGLVIRGNGTTIALRELAAEKATALEPLSKMLTDPTAPLDWSMVPALDYQHLDESAAAAWRVGHNRSAELGKWDWEKLQTTLRNTDVEWTEIGWEQAELELLTQAEWKPPVVADEPEPEAEGSDVSVSSAGASEGQVLMLKLEGVLAEQMRGLAEAQGVTPAELLAAWVEMEAAAQ